MGLDLKNSCSKCGKEIIKSHAGLFTFDQYQCDCNDKKVDDYLKSVNSENIEKRLKESGLPEVYKHDDFKDWISKEKIKSMEALIKSYYSDYASNIVHGKSIFIAGTPGVGKTRLMSWLCEKIIYNSYYSLKMITTTDLLNDVVKNKNYALVWILKNIAVLCLDDFLEHDCNNTEKEIISEIVNYRYNSNKVIFVTTMRSKDDLYRIAGEHLISRLIERSSGYMTEIESENFRLINK